MGKLSVYKQMTSAPSELLKTIKQEIGINSTCLPFAVKALDALNSLGSGLTEQQALNAANVFLSNLQTLYHGGVFPEDHDKIDFVKRGSTITISARVEAFYRAAARKGYRIVDTIVPLHKNDSNTTYFREEFQNGEKLYILEDKRNHPDRLITAERFMQGYFEKYICRLEIDDINQGRRATMITYELSNDEVIAISKSSDRGLYTSTWVSGSNGKKTKIINDGLDGRKLLVDKNSFWYKWTPDMIQKTIIRKAFKRIGNALPQLKETIYAFEQDDTYTDNTVISTESTIVIPPFSVDVNIDNLSTEQKAEAREMLEIYQANPKLAMVHAEDILNTLNSGEKKQSIINTHFASIACMKVAKGKTWTMIQPLFDAEEKSKEDSLRCVSCGTEIVSEKSISYYKSNPTKQVKCYKCSKQQEVSQ